jgi:hypothetical protein
LAIETDAVLKVSHRFWQFVVLRLELAQIVVRYDHASQIAHLLEQPQHLKLT